MNRRFTATLVIAGALTLATGRAAPAEPASSVDSSLALAALDRHIADIDIEQQSDRQELGRMGEEMVARRARVLLRGRAFYRLTRAGLLPIGGGFGALMTYAMGVERARRVLATEIDEETRLRGHATELARKLDRLSIDRSALGTQRAAMDAARATRQDDARRQVAFDRAFETSTGVASGYLPVLGGGAGGALAPDTPAGGFATARGRLLFPLVARAEASSARRQGADGSGLEIRARAGSPVRAVFAGRVAFVDRYGPYGRIVILDHGDHYYTVSGNLDEIDVKIGQDVGAGERLGTVGDDGHGSMLYFEVRHGSRTVPPNEWLGL